MSAENVVTLVECAKPVLAEQADAEIVAVLAFLLREAEAGRVRAIAISTLRVHGDDDIRSGTMFAGVDDNGSDLDRLIGSVATLQARLVSKALDDFSSPALDAPKAPA